LEPPGRRTLLRFRLLEDSPRAVRQTPRQPAAAERLHDDDRQPPFGRVVQPVEPGLRVSILVVQLYLTELPGIGVHHLAEIIRTAVEREADVPDAAVGPATGDPVLDAHLHHPLPRRERGEHVDEVEIDVVGLEPAQLLVEDPVEVG